VYPRYHQHQIAPDYGAVFFGWTAKGSTFQSFIVQYETSPLPVEQLDVRSISIKKNEYFSTSGYPAKLGADQPTKTIETFTHITATLIQMVDM